MQFASRMEVARRKRGREEDDVTSQTSQSIGSPLVDDETYTRIVDPACSECDDGGKDTSCEPHSHKLQRCPRSEKEQGGCGSNTPKDIDKQCVHSASLGWMF